MTTKDLDMITPKLNVPLEFLRKLAAALATLFVFALIFVTACTSSADANTLFTQIDNGKNNNQIKPWIFENYKDYLPRIEVNTSTRPLSENAFKICVNARCLTQEASKTRMLDHSQHEPTSELKMADNFAATSGNEANVIHVSTAAELAVALEVATGGETILLDGGNYGEFTFSDLNFASEVTIKSADAENPATFNIITMRDASNLHFDGINVDFIPDEETYAFSSAVKITDCADITFSNSTFTGGPAVNGVPPETEAGGLDETGNVLGLYTGRAFTISQCTGITIETSDISAFKNGIVVGQTDGFELLNTEIHDLRSSPLRGAEVDNVTVDGNHFYDFHPWQLGGAGDHGDFVHFWSRPSTQTEASQNITITNNFFEQGDGQSLLGIYLDDNHNGLGFENVTISNNVIYNGDRQGIRIENGDGVVIENNTLLQSSGDAQDGPTIVLRDDTKNVVIKDNILSYEMAFDDETNVNLDTITVTNNLFVQGTDATADNYVGHLFVNPFAGFDAELIDLQALPDSLVAKMGVGAALTVYGSTTMDGISGYVVDETGKGLDSLTHGFSVSEILDEGNPVDLTGATISWDFGDGRQASGDSVSHKFADAGDYKVVGTITLADGEVITVTKTVTVESPITMLLDFDQLETAASASMMAAASTGATYEDHDDGQAIRLNGTTVKYATTSEFFNNEAYTLLVDYKKDEGNETSSGRILNFSKSFVVNVEGSGLAVSVVTDQGSAWIRTGDIGLDDAEWHNIALTFSGETGAAILYVDGTEVGRIEGWVGATQVGLSGQSIYLGNPWGESFSGLIDNLAFIKGAFTAEQIASASETLATLTAAAEDVITDGGSNNGGDGAGSGDGTGSGGDTETPVEVPNVIKGSLDSEHLYGTDGNDEIYGLGGQDRIYGGDGADTIYLGDGNYSVAEGGNGADVIYGGNGSESLFGNDGNDILYAGEGTDKLFGGAGNDMLVGGGNGRDYLYGEDGDDLLIAGDVDYSALYGDAGNDTLIGGTGQDKLYGGDGNDVLIGGAGRDNMTGGAGIDQFVFEEGSGRDVIQDFNVAEDKIVLKSLGFATAADALACLFTVHDELYVNLDGPDAAFSWSTTDCVKLVGVNLEDMTADNFSLVA